MDRETLVNNLKMNLSNMSLSEFASEFMTKTKAVEEFYKLCHDIPAGKNISLMFNPHRLDIVTEASVRKISKPMSIYASLKDTGSSEYTEKIDGLARLYLYNLEHGVSDPFYCAVQRGYNGVAYVNEFPPFVARHMLLDNKIKGTDRVYVLDPCGGWGGRMIGCASLPNVTYIACEPSTDTYNGLMKLGEWLQSLQPSFKYKVYKLPYEDFDIDREFDIAFTSPPYYNTEIYCDEETNSLNRYDTFESWVDGFYKPLILNTVKRLKDKGIFILNIGDRKYPLSDTMMQICRDNNIYVDRTKDYLSGNGEAKEKFYCLSKQKLFVSKQRLF